MTTPVQLASQIRFYLEQLSAQNGHHEFERLSFWLTKNRFCLNVRPATGPVSAGGDQGRDFETFSVFLRSIVQGAEYFAGTADARVIAFACSLEKDAPSKIKSDVTKIMSAGTAVGMIVFFSGSDINVAKRHDLEEWAQKEHAVKLEIHDAQSIAVLLTEPELWWIAREFLKVADAVFPEQAAPQTAPDTAAAGGAVASGLTMEMLNAQMAQLSAAIGKTRLTQVADIKEALRRGRAEDALARLRELKGEADWDILANEVKAKVCHLEANLLMATDGSLDEASTLVDEGTKLDATLHPQFLHGRIAFYREGAVAALAVVENPATLDAWNLRGSLLIEEDRFEEAEAQFVAADFTPDHETARLRTMSALIRGDLAAARAHIEPALVAHPTWFSLRYAKALVDYFSILSPALVPGAPKSWPAPVDPAFLKRDAESIGHLTAAETAFREMADAVQLGEPLRRMLQGWRLACLGCDLTRREEAMAYCEQLLAETPGHTMALMWAEARGFAGDLTPSIDALRSQVLTGDASAESCTTFFALLNSREDADGLSEAVAKAEPPFKESPEIWQFWRAQVHLLQGEIQDALALAAATADTRTAEVIRRLALRRQWNLGGSPEPLSEHLKAQFEATGGVDLLFEFCELRARLNDWKAVAQHAEELVWRSGSIAAVRLGAGAAWNMHDHRLCLRLLRENQHLFPDHQLPPDLERHAVLCETQCGMFDEALLHARQLASTQGELQDVALQFNLEVSRGDLRSAALTARALKTKPELPASDLLRAAKVIRHVDQGTARDLVAAAVSRGARDAQTAIDALVLSDQLDLRHVVPQLEAFLNQRVAAGEVRFLDENEILAQIRARAESAEQAIQQHARGEMSVHALGDYVPRPMAQAFHRLAQSNRARPDPFQQEPILAWHGGRRREPRFFSGTRLHLDLTGLLTAKDLEILDLIETQFAPIYLAPAIPHCLLQQLEKTQPAASSRASWLEEVIRHLHDFEPSSATPKTGRTVSFEEIKVGLGRLGLLSESESGGVQAVPGVATLARGEGGTLAPAAAEMLAANGLLERAAHAFRLRLPPGEREAIANWLRDYQESVRLHDWINELCERISRSDGPYRLFGVRYRDDEKLPEMVAPDLGCLIQITSIENKNDAVLWCDDRYLNSFQKCGGVPTVTVIDVLDELYRRGILDAAGCYGKLQDLRASNARYVPLGRDELLHHVRRARVENGAVIETPELSTLRRYYSACLLDTGRLQPPAPSSKRPPMGEIHLFADLYLEISTAILELWSSCGDEFADAEARSTWVLTSLWQDSVALVGTFSPALEKGLFDEMLAMSLSHLFMQAITLAGGERWPREKGATPRQRYFAWLDRRYSLRSRGRLKSLAVALRRDFEDRGWLVDDDKRVQSAQREALGEFFHELPRPIRDFVPLSRGTMTFLGLEKYSATRVNDLEFDFRDFWRTAERAWRGRPARLHTKDGSLCLTVMMERKGDGTPPNLIFIKPGESRRGVNDDPLLGLLDRDPVARRRVLDAHRDWFDCDESSFRRHANRISELRCVHERIRQAISVREESPVHFYTGLATELTRTDLDERPFLPPPLLRLIARLRLEVPRDSKDCHVALAQAARTLVSEVGLEEAIYRCSSLPAELPEPVLSKFDALSADAAEMLLTRLDGRMQQPFARLQLARLWLRYARRRGLPPDRARNLVAETLADSAAPRFDAFLTLARWAVQRLWERDGSPEPQAGALLAAGWSHAAEVFNVLAQHDARWEAVTENIASRFGPRAEYFFASEEPLKSDAGHPRDIDRVSGLVHACAATVLIEDPTVSQDFGIAAFAEAGFFLHEEGRQVPNPIFREDPATLPDSIGSFFARDRGAALEAALGAERAMPFFSATWQDLVQEALNTAMGQPPGTGHWSLLSILLATRTPPPRFHGLVGDLLRSVSLQQIYADAPTSWKMTLIFCARQAREIGGEAAAHLKAEIVRLAQKFAAESAPASNETDGGRAIHLTEAARHLALGAPTGVARARAFGEVVNEILRAWPRGALHVHPAITVLSFHLPYREAAELMVTRALVLAQMRVA